tara:strand:- start:1547 stop:2431 length:885 start_codon:yes stop_codon:yes gene_type:complete
MNNSVINQMPFYSGSNHVLEFDGVNDYLQLGDTANLQYTKANIDSHGLTVIVWYYGIGSTTGHGEAPLFRVGTGDGSDNNYYGYTFSINNNGYMVAHLFGNQGSGAGAGHQNRTTRTSTTALSANRWNMLTFVLPDSDKANWQFYINNGFAQTMNTCTGTACGTATNYPVYYSSPKTYIGWNGRTTSSDFMNYGFLGDIAIYKTELPQNAIQALYGRATASPATNGNDLLEPTGNYTQTHALNLKGWWRMGDPYGTDSHPSINDEHTVNSNDTRYTATMTNMVSGDIVTTPLWG